jgi:TonB family protein
MIIAALLAAVLLSVQERPADPVAELATARTLYASASYEEALERLSRAAQSEGLLDEVDTYRALCLLALGRTSESERALEQILLRNPGYTLDDDEVSPRLVMVFQAVRARVLPTAARNLYAAARASYDDRKYEVAAAQLQELLVLISPANVPESAVGLAELRMLSEGFLKLSESMMGPAEPASASGAEASGSSAGPKAPVYSVLNRDVIAPVEISRPVPKWEAPRGTPKGLYQGLVEVVINEKGRIDSAVIRKSVSPSYDADLVHATGEWRFQPATKEGVPVKYRRFYEVILHSR